MASDSVRLQSIHAEFSISRPARRVVLVTISGRDTGELGDAPFQELEKDLAGSARPELFVDARATVGASVDVSAAWARWLVENKQRYAQLHFLTGSRFVQITASFVHRFTDLGEQMRIYTDPNAFEAALTEASGCS